MHVFNTAQPCIPVYGIDIQFDILQNINNQFYII